MKRRPRKLPKYPADHRVGMRVPHGGSDCAKCEYHEGQRCRKKEFVRWNGSDLIPAPINSYCCDFFEAEKNGRAEPVARLRKAGKEDEW